MQAMLAQRRDASAELTGGGWNAAVRSPATNPHALVLAAVAADTFSAADLPGTWSGMAVHEGDSTLIALELPPAVEGRTRIKVSIPAIFIDRVTFGDVRAVVWGDSVRLGPFEFVYHAADGSLRGNVPAGLLPVYTVPMTLHEVAGMPTVAASVCTAPAPKPACCTHSMHGPVWWAGSFAPEAPSVDGRSCSTTLSTSPPATDSSVGSTHEPARADGSATRGSRGWSRRPVHAYDVRDGRLAWKTSVRGWAWAAPTVTKDRVYIGTVGSASTEGRQVGAANVIDRRDGRLIARLPALETGSGQFGFAGAAARGDGLVFFPGLDGTIVAFPQ